MSKTPDNLSSAEDDIGELIKIREFDKNILNGLYKEFINWSRLESELKTHWLTLTPSIVEDSIYTALQESLNSTNSSGFLSFINSVATDDKRLAKIAVNEKVAIEVKLKDLIGFLALGFALGMQWGSEVSKSAQTDNQSVNPKIDPSCDETKEGDSSTSVNKSDQVRAEHATEEYRKTQQHREQPTPSRRADSSTPPKKTTSGTSNLGLETGSLPDLRRFGKSALNTIFGKFTEPPEQKPYSNRYLLTILYADRLGNPCSIGEISQERIKTIVSQARFMKVFSDEKAAEYVLNGFITSDEAIDYSQSINVVLLIEIFGTDDLLDARLSSEFELALNPDTNALATIIAVKRLESIAGVRQALHALV